MVPEKVRDARMSSVTVLLSRRSRRPCEGSVMGSGYIGDVKDGVADLVKTMAEIETGLKFGFSDREFEKTA